MLAVFDTAAPQNYFSAATLGILPTACHHDRGETGRDLYRAIARKDWDREQCSLLQPSISRWPDLEREHYAHHIAWLREAPRWNRKEHDYQPEQARRHEKRQLVSILKRTQSGDPPQSDFSALDDQSMRQLVRQKGAYQRIMDRKNKDTLVIELP